MYSTNFILFFPPVWSAVVGLWWDTVELGGGGGAAELGGGRGRWWVSQQQPPDEGLTVVPGVSFTLGLSPPPAVAPGPILFLISAAMVMKACSTLVAFLALVSKKGIPRESANSCKHRAGFRFCSMWSLITNQ